jgi:stress-induced morphogen
VARQRLVYAALAELMRERIHALSITALAPGELPGSTAAGR